MPAISEQLKNLPDSPGIYLYYNGAGDLIYVGKATSLKSRVGSYFKGARTSRPIEQLIHEVETIKWKETDSALEALILESIYIKKHQPKYNVLGKDSKSWNYIVVTRDDYPRVLTMRQHDLSQISPADIKKKFLYVFGPYPGLNRRETIKLLARIFHISFCVPSVALAKDGLPPQQKRPCLYYEMGQCLGVCVGHISARDYRRQVIAPLATLLRGQKKQLLARVKQQMNRAARAEQFELAARYRNQFQALTRLHDVAILNQSFFTDPLAAQVLPRNKTIARARRTAAAEGASYNTERIEGYDISNLGTTGKVGSMVVFTHGEADKGQYRKFKIRSVEGQSDVDCLAEMIERRLNHAEWPLPFAFLIDGGRPQVNRVRAILAARGVMVPVVGIAKGPERKRNDFEFGSAPSDDTEAQREFVRWVSANQETLIRVRDEAHRFAISYQRKLRKI